MIRIDTAVLVVGGGTAGVTAALSAARRGAQVVLVERDGALGGVATRAGIHIYYHGRSAGIQQEIDCRTATLAGQLGGKPRGFHPEARRLAIAQMLAEAGCQVLFNAVAVQVLQEGPRVQGVVCETPNGPVTIMARMTIDATGDGDICALAGVPFTHGRDWDGLANCYSLIPRLIRDNQLNLLSFDAGWVDATNALDLSQAYGEGRHRLLSMLGYHVAYPTLLSVAPQLGIRESRLIQGEYRLTLRDLAMDQRFPDVVMRCQAHYDLHTYDYANESLFAQIWICVLGFWTQPVGGDVPFRCLIPQGVEGLLIGCRALSLERDTSLALRMQRDILQIGEVAGTAAALCSQHGCGVRELDVTELQQCLVEQGVLSEADLHRPSRPWVELPGMGFGSGEDAEPGEAQSGEPERLEKLIDALGTASEGQALWWLWQAGEAAVAPLLKRLHAETGVPVAQSQVKAARVPGSGANEFEKVCRGVALALALLDNHAGVAQLVQAVERRDSDRLPGERSPERWVACLIALGSLRDWHAVPAVLTAIPTEADSALLLHLLHYLIKVAHTAPDNLKADIATCVKNLLSRPQLGEDFRLWGGQAASIRWSIELAVAYLLAALGDPQANTLFAGYQDDVCGYIRRAAQLVQERAERDYGQPAPLGDQPQKEGA